MASVLSAALEKALNQYLRLDPDGLRAFTELEGKVIAVELRGLDSTLYLVPNTGCIRVLDQFEGEPDTWLCGTPLALAKLGISDAMPAGLFSDDVEIRGDIDTGKRFKDLLDNLDIDWEEPLARFSGDVFAHQVGNTVRRTSHWASQNLKTLVSDLSEYLTEEARLLPTRIELENWYGDVDELRMSVDRIEARLRRLREKAQPTDTGSRP
jgi:ubiquinone biosynthesis protein UbiJ